MKKDKEKIIKLRKEGKSYSQIKKEIKTSSGTLSKLFIDKKWSNKIKEINTNKNIKNGIKVLEKVNHAKKNSFKKEYEEVKINAKKEFDLYKNDPLFMSGLMIYAGEGDKRDKYKIRIANSEFYLHLIFIDFLEKFLKIEKNKIKFWLLLYKDHNTEEMIEIWSNKIKINKNNFYKTQVIKGREKNKKLQYGVGNSIISSRSLKIKLLEWLNICENNYT